MVEDSTADDRGNPLIEGVMVKHLKVHTDERGFLMEILRKDDKIFERFAQSYLTVCNPGYAKAWHYHKKQTDHFYVVRGKGRIVLYDIREQSKTKGMVNKFICSLDNPRVIKIPPLVFHGFEAVGDEPCYIINYPTELYNYKQPDEFRMPFNSPDIPFQWKAKKGG